nr:translation initiation factor IF-2-like [Pongo abelii]
MNEPTNPSVDRILLAPLCKGLCCSPRDGALPRRAGQARTPYPQAAPPPAPTTPDARVPAALGPARLQRLRLAPRAPIPTPTPLARPVPAPRAPLPRPGAAALTTAGPARGSAFPVCSLQIPRLVQGKPLPPPSGSAAGLRVRAGRAGPGRGREPARMLRDGGGGRARRPEAAFPRIPSFIGSLFLSSILLCAAIFDGKPAKELNFVQTSTVHLLSPCLPVTTKQRQGERHVGKRIPCGDTDTRGEDAC